MCSLWEVGELYTEVKLKEIAAWKWRSHWKAPGKCHPSNYNHSALGLVWCSKFPVSSLAGWNHEMNICHWGFCELYFSYLAITMALKQWFCFLGNSFVTFLPRDWWKSRLCWLGHVSRHPACQGKFSLGSSSVATESKENHFWYNSAKCLKMVAS